MREEVCLEEMCVCILEDLCVVRLLMFCHVCSRQFVWDILDSTLLKQNKAYAQANKELTDVQEELRKVSDLDAVALGVETRQDLERKKELAEEKLEECEKIHKDIFVFLCQKLVRILSSHLVTCDMEKADHATPWFCCTLDYLRQLLVQVCEGEGAMCVCGHVKVVRGVYVWRGEDMGVC